MPWPRGPELLIMGPNPVTGNVLGPNTALLGPSSRCKRLWEPQACLLDKQVHGDTHSGPPRRPVP